MINIYKKKNTGREKERKKKKLNQNSIERRVVWEIKIIVLFFLGEGILRRGLAQEFKKLMKSTWHETIKGEKERKQRVLKVEDMSGFLKKKWKKKYDEKKNPPNQKERKKQEWLEILKERGCREGYDFFLKKKKS